MKVFLCFAVFFLSNFQFVFATTWFFNKTLQELKNLRSQYVNRKADLVFLIDTSGSLSRPAYETEKDFVRDLLNEISVGTEASRVEVIPFGNTASIYIDQVSNPGITKNKCTFNEKFNRMEQKINGWSTNMKAGFELAFSVCLGNYSGQKRTDSGGKPIKTTVLLLTDGEWNWNANPVSLAQDLHEGGVEVFAIGVGQYLNMPNLQQITAIPDRQAFKLADFKEFAKLAKYLRGGKLNVVLFLKISYYYY